LNLKWVQGRALSISVQIPKEFLLLFLNLKWVQGRALIPSFGTNTEKVKKIRISEN